MPETLAAPQAGSGSPATNRRLIRSWLVWAPMRRTSRVTPGRFLWAMPKAEIGRDSTAFQMLRTLSIAWSGCWRCAVRQTSPTGDRLAVCRRSDQQDFTFYLTAGVDDQLRMLIKYAQNELAPADARIAIVSSDDGAGLAIDEAVRQQNREWAPTLSLRFTAGDAIADIVSQLRRAAVNVIFFDGGADQLVALAEEAT